MSLHDHRFLDYYVTEWDGEADTLAYIWRGKRYPTLAALDRAILYSDTDAGRQIRGSLKDMHLPLESVL